MSLVVRKFEPNKWRQRKIFEGESPSADAITNCLRTRRNTLSVWVINNSTELEEAVLAIVSQFDHLDTADFLIIELSMLEEANLNVVSSEGKTPYTDYKELHRDISDLTYESIGSVAKVIIESLRRKYSARFTRAKLKELLRQGIESGKINRDEVNESILQKL